MLDRPGVDGLRAAVGVLREWQYDAAPLQLHPGDLGWFWRFGAQATAAAVRTWSRDGQIVAVGLLDGSTLLRLTSAPDAQQDEELADQLVQDVTDPDRGVLTEREVAVEASTGALVHDLLSANGWNLGEPWSPLRRDLTDPVEDPEVPIAVIAAKQGAVWTAVHRAAFDRSTLTDERWQAMTTGFPYTDARSLVAYAEQSTAVAAVTVWAAGPGKPGLIEPMGVHRRHRGHGYGKAITVAAAAALQELGSSSAIVLHADRQSRCRRHLSVSRVRVTPGETGSSPHAMTTLRRADPSQRSAPGSDHLGDVGQADRSESGQVF